MKNPPIKKPILGGSRVGKTERIGFVESDFGTFYLHPEANSFLSDLTKQATDDGRKTSVRLARRKLKNLRSAFSAISELAHLLKIEPNRVIVAQDFTDFMHWIP